MRYVLTWILSSLLAGVQAQVVVNGTVGEAGSGEPLAYVQVRLQGSRSGVLSNTEGYFSISLPAGRQVLTFQQTGYRPHSLALELNHDTTLKVLLTPYQTVIDTVEITAQEGGAYQMAPSRLIVPVKQLAQVPMLAGEADVLKAMQLLPGIQFGKEGTSGLFVRGGSADQNLILFDDIPIYNANHLFGFASLFPPASLKSVEIFKGGFPAEFGGRLSSVVRLQSREGDLKQRKTRLSLGSISGQLTTEGPLVKGKSSYLLSARSTWLNFLLKPILKGVFRKEGIKGFLGYGFYDLVGKANYLLSDKDRLYLSVYAGRDRADSKVEASSRGDSLQGGSLKVKRNSAMQWGNLAASLRYHRIMGARWFAKSILGYSQYAYANTRLLETIDSQTAPERINRLKFSMRSRIWDVHAKQLFYFQPATPHKLSFGLAGSFKHFRPDFRATETLAGGVQRDSTFNERNINSYTLSVFGEDQWQPSIRWNIRAGLRLEAFRAPGLWRTSLQPRLTAQFQPNEHNRLSLAYSYIQQYLHLLSNTGLGLPADLWVPATRLVPPAASHQLVAGWETKGPFNSRIVLEAYYKTFSKVIAYKEGASLFNTFDSWQNKVTNGRGRAYGFECWLNKASGKLNGWLSYSLSWNNRQFAQLNQGRTFPYKYDRRHKLSIFLNYALKPQHKTLSITWMYLSGSWQTVPVGIANVPYDLMRDLLGGTENIITQQGITGFGNVLPYAPARNNYRLRPFHKLDLAYQLRKEKKRHTRTWSYGIYNLYGRRNPYFVFYQSTLEYNPNFGPNQQPGPQNNPYMTVNRLAEQSFLFWIPYISLALEF